MVPPPVNPSAGLCAYLEGAEPVLQLGGRSNRGDAAAPCLARLRIAQVSKGGGGTGHAGTQGPGPQTGEMKAKVRNTSTSLGHAVQAVLRMSVPTYYKP